MFFLKKWYIIFIYCVSSISITIIVGGDEFFIYLFHLYFLIVNYNVHFIYAFFIHYFLLEKTRHRCEKIQK